MWSKLLLCALICSSVNLTVASDNGWRAKTEYIYDVNGRTLTGLHDVANQYSGILINAKLAVRPQENELLTVKIFNAKYSEVHEHLAGGWKSKIPEGHLNVQDLPLSEEPFQVKMENGVVKQLVFESEVENWEANIIKSFVSQMQLDTLAQNVVESHINQLPEKGSNNAVYKTMEDSVTGVYETLYDIAPLPKYVLGSQPWLAPIADEQDELLEIVKSKNFSNAGHLEYHYGLGGMGSFEAASNKMKDFFLRSSLSRAVISGSLEHYIIQSSTTTNKIILAPTLNNKENGLVVSHVNITLHSIKACSGPFQISQHEKHNSLSYRSVEAVGLHQDSSAFLPFYIGYNSQTAKNSNIVETAQKVAEQIGEEIEHPHDIPKDQTLAKYVILSKIVRVMCQGEMETVGEKLYTKEERGPKAQAWYAYRDAIGECGTAPALLTVQNWINQNKIGHEEAAEVIAAVAESVRLPTEKYMHDFQKLVEDVQHQAILNDTALLSFATLVRNVYVNEKYSNNEYPGKIATQNGTEYVVVNVIPDLIDKLHQAIKSADSHKILVYIRALGNVGHQRILEAFEPYLEGTKHCSQFQRLQMVIALDKLVKTQPKVARSVLYKIYQNSGEQQELRVAAVYQIMRCKPTAAMLQRMAEYTNIDTNEQVNAAVVSAVNSAAQMKTKEFAKLKADARAAQPLLTTQKYSAEYSGDYLRDYFQKEMKLSYKQTVQVYGSQDSFIPKGIKYAFRVGLGGTRRQLCITQAMVSSVKELTNVFERQTEQYRNDNQQHKSHYQQTQKNQWSSESIAKLLKIENIEREQLEGSILLQLAGGVTRFFTFDNQTLEDLPKVLGKYEEELREGKEFQYTKFLNRYETAVSFPTEMGMPFFFTLDAPTLLHTEGQIRAVAEPKACHEDFIGRPDTITGETEIRAVVSTKVEAKLGFITFFNNKQYISGYHKNLQVRLPIKSNIEVDLKNGDIQAKVEVINPEENVQIFHYSTLPFTSQLNIFHLDGVANNPHTKIIYSRKSNHNQWHGVIGKEAGIALLVDYASDQKFFDAYWLYEQFKRSDAISAWLSPIYDETVIHTKLDVYYSADNSTSRQVKIRAGFESRYETEQGKKSKPQFSELPEESRARQQQFAKMASSGIHSAQAYAVDAVIEFDGPKQVQYRATVAQASGPVDPKARALLYFTKKSSDEHIKPTEIAAVAEADAPNTNGLDFNYALKFDPTTKAHVEISIGENLHSAAKFNIQAKLEQSESRRQYLKQHPRAEECREEMKQGNQQLPACANMTQEAKLLDRAHVKIKFEHVGAECRNATKKMYNALRYLAYFNLEENRENATGSGNEDQLDIFVRFEPDFETANVTLQSHHLDAHIDNIRFYNWVQQVVSINPVFGLNSRIMSEAMGYDTYKPYCVVDQSAANTFDNKTYPIQLGNDWTVMMQYVPDYARTGHEGESYEEQRRDYQHEQYSVLVRNCNKDQKEVKITIRTPATKGRIIEIDLKPDQQQPEHNSKLYVNQKQYEINDQHSTDIEDDLVQMYALTDDDVKIHFKSRQQQSNHNYKVYVNQKQYQINNQYSTDFEDGVVKMYVIANGVVKIEVIDSFSLIYDGERVQIIPIRSKLRSSVRGLCGTFAGEKSNDFLTPENCIVADHEDFVQSYTLNRSANYKSACYQPKQLYSNVISDIDIGRPSPNQHQTNEQSGRAAQENGCTKYQIRHVKHAGQICFTRRPLPVCMKGCNEGELVEKRVDVHCIQDISIARLWQKQIAKGVGPDFLEKQVTNNLRVRVPGSCYKAI